MMKQQPPESRRVRARCAFTLVELLVVIGLMAMLGTVAVGGYFAAVRGMSDRGAEQDTISLLRLAKQTCLIEHTPTAVFFFNKRLLDQADDDTGAAVAGGAIAIKMTGRISFVRGDILVDEFADWNQSHPVGDDSSSAQGAGVRFYRMQNLSGQVKGGIDACSSIVEPFVTKVTEFGEEYMISSGLKVREFCDLYKKRGEDNAKFSESSYLNANSWRWGFKVTSGLAAGSWKIGDAYGVEIASLQLPQGYIFGSQPPSSTEIDEVSAVVFQLEGNGTVGANTYQSLRAQGNLPKLSAYRMKKGGGVGADTFKTITDKDLDD